ncbi:MAG: redox-regulated ATPase YchF [SAR202 cluster bacterium]|jgi:hypothetical protein|nr:redox-regulated ATPase YchF [SAR202 cluster bacterium]MDP6512166.1 redox-regulated ATPase YchF [SAR202 cluster bacterium]MDP6713494.1 redox-regulated ATPase YchF [SAR202 cluster bacterium]
MDIAIVGLPRSGKTTIFNAVTRGAAQVAAFSSQTKPNIGVAKVPDDRLQPLVEIFEPAKITHAEVTYVDIPAAPEGLGQSKGISGEYLNQLQRSDALVIVARAFDDPSVPDEGNGVDAVRDIETMLYELTFADLGIIERRLERIRDNLKSAKTTERDRLTREQALFGRLKDGLEEGVSLRRQSLTPDEARQVEGFQFLTNKPVIVVANVGEDDIDKADDIEAELNSKFGGDGVLTAALSGKLEMELSQMDPEDEKEFRESLDAGESGLDRMMSLSYQALDQLTFFTCGPTEVRAWTVTKGVTAPQAAGKIHSDMERGFIRAEVVGYDDMIQTGSMAEARKQGVFRQEGKSYVVTEADVVLILFNV